MNPFFARARVTRVLLVALGLAFIAELALGGSTDRLVLVRLGANVPGRVLAGEWWRLAASMFLHVGLLHLLVNGWALYQLGGLYESLVGSRRFAAVYFASGILASLGSVLFLPTPESLSAGASGAVFGLLGALMALLLRRRQRLTPAARSLLAQLAGWAVLNVILGFSVPNIDNAAHLTGFAVGMAFGWWTPPRWEQAPPPPPPPASTE